MKKNIGLLSLSLLLLFIYSPFFGQEIINEKEPYPWTKIEFEESVFNFGEIDQGEVVQNVMQFTNTGENPLIIINAKGSCGCTVPSWPKDAILPGETGEILVRFDSKGKKGNQTKRVTLTCNTEPVVNYLMIKGKVLVTEKGSSASKDQISSKEVDESTFIVYPNPTSEYLNLSIPNYEGKSVQIDIFDNLGQRLEQKTIDEIGVEPVIFNVRQFREGVYTISIKVAEMNRIAKQFTVVFH